MDQRTGFGKRFLAILVDGVLTAIGGMIIGFLFGGFLGGLIGASVGGATASDPFIYGLIGGALGSFLGTMIGVCIFGVLYGLVEAFTGASPGKMVLGIKIGNPDGTTAQIGKLFSRYVIKNIGLVGPLAGALMGMSFLTAIGNLMGFVIFIGCFLALGSSKQALHDKIVMTAVYPKSNVK